MIFRRNDFAIKKRFLKLTWDIFLKLAAAIIKIIATNENQLVQTACPEKTLNAIETPKIPDPVKSTYATINNAPVISLTTGPPTTSAISAIPWHPRWLFLKSPWITAAHVFSKPQPTTLSVPPTAPRSYMAVGIVRTPTAKMTFRKITVARGHSTVRKLTPAVVLKTSNSSLSLALKTPPAIALAPEASCSMSDCW
jgi:hypothetical protein